MPAEIKVRIDGAWVDVGGAAPAGGEEVQVAGAQPTDPATDLWYDEADPGTPGGAAVEEVVAGTVAPTDPATELWVDTTDPAAPALKVKDNTGTWIAVGGGGGAAAEPWVALPLMNGWTADSDRVPMYRKVGDEVQLRGMARAAAATGHRIADMPAGYGSAKNATFICNVGGVPTSVFVLDSWGQFGVQVDSAIPLPTTYAFLDPIRFSVTL